MNQKYKHGDRVAYLHLDRLPVDQRAAGYGTVQGYMLDGQVIVLWDGAGCPGCGMGKGIHENALVPIIDGVPPSA